MSEEQQDAKVEETQAEEAAVQPEVEAKPEPATETPAEPKVAAKEKPASDQVNDFQPMVAGFKAKLLAGKAKMNTLIAEKAPIVKDALIKQLDKLADHANEAKVTDAEKAKEAEAEAEALKAKAEAQKAKAAAEKPAEPKKEEAPKAEEPPKEEPKTEAEPAAAASEEEVKEAS